MCQHWCFQLNKWTFEMPENFIIMSLILKNTHSLTLSHTNAYVYTHAYTHINLLLESRIQWVDEIIDRRNAINHTNANKFTIKISVFLYVSLCLFVRKLIYLQYMLTLVPFIIPFTNLSLIEQNTIDFMKENSGIPVFSSIMIETAPHSTAAILTTWKHRNLWANST